MFLDAERITLVMDNLNTHMPGSLTKIFTPAEAHRIARCLDIHCTPKHGRWLNIAEVELNVLTRQRLNRRIDCIRRLQDEITAREQRRNREATKGDCQFRTSNA